MVRAMCLFALGVMLGGCDGVAGPPDDRNALEKFEDIVMCPADGMCDAGDDALCDRAEDFCRHGACGGDHDHDGEPDCDFAGHQHDEREVCEERRRDLECTVDCKRHGCETHCEIDRCDTRCADGACEIRCHHEHWRACEHGECPDLCSAVTCEVQVCDDHCG